MASGDLQARCADGTAHDRDRWAERKRALTAESSSRWAGAITKASNELWALARRGQQAHLRSLEAGIAILRARLALPIGAAGTGGKPGGYRSRREWFAKSRRLQILSIRLEAVRADHDAGRVRVVRGGRRLANTRHHLDAAGLTDSQWRARWEAARWFLTADGESGKKYGNETLRITPDGEISLKLPAPLAGWANAPHGRYVLAARVGFAHRGEQWRARVSADQAVAYRIDYDPARDRWYVTASWQHPATPDVPLAAARAEGVIGVDVNADHCAAYRLDRHGNPIGNPRRFDLELTGSTARRDAQVRHALTGILSWARREGVSAIVIEDLNFDAEKTREKHGRRKGFRRLLSGLPTGILRTRLVSMSATAGISVIAVDPAYTSRWGGKYWRTPPSGGGRELTRHEAAAVAIGRRGLGHRIRRRMPPPRPHRSDGAGPRSIQTAPEPGTVRDPAHP
ncbi:hypothetical protein [Nocardia huaxiensis]|uniref:hypothetical protein n=1 Tax=Nocardia huaxiensis TaxID=2755382 RepID=UPI001C66B8CD|nr:hypothetical protein [Nocardia huaxiensis]